MTDPAPNTTPTPTPDALACGMTHTDLLSWYAKEPNEAKAYAASLGADIHDPGTLPGGITVEQFKAAQTANPFWAVRYLDANGITTLPVDTTLKVVPIKTAADTFVELMKTNPIVAARFAEHHGLIKRV